MLLVSACDSLVLTISRRFFLFTHAIAEGTKAVCLEINCPGGQVVQSFMIYDQIRRLAEERNIPVYAFVEDVGASGGYLMSIAADQIYADQNSLVGSIGVVSIAHQQFHFASTLCSQNVADVLRRLGTNCIY